MTTPRAPATTRILGSLGPATGSPDALRGFARAGINHVQVWLEPHTMAAIDAFAPVLERLDRG